MGLCSTNSARNGMSTRTTIFRVRTGSPPSQFILTLQENGKQVQHSNRTVNSDGTPLFPDLDLTAMTPKDLVTVLEGFFSDLWGKSKFFATVAVLKCL